MKKRMVSLLMVLCVMVSLFSAVTVAATDESVLQEYYGGTFRNTEKAMYALQDMNSDGVPELFLTDGENKWEVCSVYTNINGEEIFIGYIDMGYGLYSSDDGKVYYCSGGNGSIMYSELGIFDFSVGILENPYLVAWVQWDVEEYYCNAYSISMDEFLALEAELSMLMFDDVFELPEPLSVEEESDDNGAKEAYRRVLEDYINEWGGEYINYTVFDLDGDGVCELIVDLGGSDGSQCYSYKDGAVKEYGHFSANVQEFYKKDGNMYILMCILVDVSEQGNTHEVVLLKPFLGAYEVEYDILYENSNVKSSRFEDVPVPEEVENIIGDATVVEFRNIRDFSLLEEIYTEKETPWAKEEVSVVPDDKDITDFESIVSPWAKEEVEEAYQKGLVPETLVGKDLTQKINRAEFAAIAVSVYEQLSEKELSAYATPFIDIDTDPNKKEIEKAYTAGITVGIGERIFEPETFITREQLATMLCRAVKKYKFPEWTIDTDDQYYMQEISGKRFADDNEISDYARNSVYFMSGIGIIKGVDETHFAPKANVTMQEAINYGMATREQAIVMANRIRKLQDAIDDM